MPRKIDVGNYNDTLSLSDITDRVEELRDDRDSYNDDDDDGNAWAGENPEDADELETLEGLLSELRGEGGNHKWEGDWYPDVLIRDSAFTEYAQGLVEDIGDLPRNLPSYIEIDWEATARNLQADYSTVEYDGVTYWYRA